jgi:hypothetical protein
MKVRKNKKVLNVLARCKCGVHRNQKRAVYRGSSRKNKYAHKEQEND